MENLIEVRTFYDELEYVRQADMDSEKRMLPMFHPDGRPKKTNQYGPTVTDWMPNYLHRDNICPHARESWVKYSFPDGSPGDYCPICTPQ